VTDESYIEAFKRRTGIDVPAPKPSDHKGPSSAKRLVEAYGCHVFPLALGSKVPTAETRGVLDAKPSADQITGNYGVAMGPSNLVALDLDDYVADHQVEEFLAEFELPPTFTVKTGSGGRSLWFRAPSIGAEVIRPKMNLLGYRGVDIRANESYALGPGNKLHPDNVKKGAPGDGVYTFDKESPKEFAPLPLKLLAAIGREFKEKEARRKDVAAGSTAGFAQLSQRDQMRATKITEAALAGEVAAFDAMQHWPEGHSDEKGGWENNVLERTAALASLVLAEWSPLTAERVIEELEMHLPHDSGFTIREGISKFERALENVSPRPWIGDEDDEWFEAFPMVAPRPFAEASAAPGVSEERRVTEWPKYEQNDFGNSQRLAAWAAGTLAWLHDDEIWVRYNGTHWERSKSAGKNAAINALNVAYNLEQRHYSDETTGDEKKSPREKFEAWILSQKMANRYYAAAEVAKDFEAMNRSGKDFDANPYLLGVQNGTVDLRTGELRPGTQEEMIATVVPVRYDPEAKAPRFQEYLEESMPDPEVRAYPQRVMGYSITGETIEQLMFIHHGETNNGKSVLMDIMRKVLGDWAGGADPKALIETRSEQHSTHIASLAGPRMLLMSESARGARLADTLIKNVTGGDMITARFMRQDNQDFEIVGKIHMATNHLPHIVSSKSTNRRIHLITWPVTIPDEKIDLLLAEKIVANEKEGVLAWLVQGAVDWWTLLQATQKVNRKSGRPSGLGAPAQVLVDTAKYLRDEDEVAEWMDERVEVTDAPAESAGNLYQDYKLWCEKRGGRAMTQKALSVELGLRGFEKTKTRNYAAYPLRLRPLQVANNWFDDTK
jgi:putative DNA primase/helicase